ncbi:MAG: hypothetical protein QOF51_676 [Chloroflexota bacterium]|jgi:hypothetical protein|nr:hypothetical protein [Chloroflexota bacterium]
MRFIPSDQLARFAFPIVALVFLGLYVWGLLSGAVPELALARAGLAGAGLALLLRFGLGIVDAIVIGIALEEVAASDAATDVAANQS